MYVNRENMYTPEVIFLNLEVHTQGHGRDSGVNTFYPSNGRIIYM